MHELRRGLASHPAVSELVQSAQRPLPPRDDGIKPTTLFPTKRDVETLNQKELEQLDRATERTYVAKDRIEPDNETRLGLVLGLGLGLGLDPNPYPYPYPNANQPAAHAQPEHLAARAEGLRGEGRGGRDAQAAPGRAGDAHQE